MCVCGRVCGCEREREREREGERRRTFEVGDVFCGNFQTSWLDQEGLPKTLLSGSASSSGAKGSSSSESTCRIDWVRKRKRERES